jgi:hypothetical protein
MNNSNDEAGSVERLAAPVVVAVNATDFQLKVLEKLGRLEAKMDMLTGNGQPGRMSLVENRVVFLEKNDLRRTIYDRLITAAISFGISASITWHDHFGLK